MLARHTSDRLMMPCFWGQASGRPAGLQWPTATRVMFGGMACLVETDVEAALVHGHFQLLFVILVATKRLALERSREIALGFPCQIVPVIYDSSRFFCVKPWL